MRKTEKTQWASTYLVAAELTRREYRVGWPMGNAPVRDLLVESPSGKQFYVDVKGGSYKSTQPSYWHPVQKERIELEKALPDLYFIFVRVDPDPAKACEFFVLSHGELLKEVPRGPVSTSSGQPLPNWNTPGIGNRQLQQYRSWKSLPT